MTEIKTTDDKSTPQPPIVIDPQLQKALIAIAVLNEKMDHLIRTQEDNGRAQRETNRSLQSEIAEVKNDVAGFQKDLRDVREIVVSARVSVRTLIMVAVAIGGLVAVVTEILSVMRK